MPATNGREMPDFTPTVFDIDELEPECPKGMWQATCKIKKHVSKDKRNPMLIAEWKLEETDDEENQTHLGKTVGDFIGFPAKGAKGGNFRKIHLRQLCEATGTSTDLVPRGEIKRWEDLEDLIQALDGAKAVIYTTVKTEESGESRVNVKYAKPPGFDASSDAEEEEEEEEAPAKKTLAKKPAPKGKPANSRRN